MNLGIDKAIGAVIYFFGLLFAESLRFPYRAKRIQSQNNWHSGNGLARLWEIPVLIAVISGIWALPAIYVFTDWIEQFDYMLPEQATYLAAMIFVPNLFIRWAAHRSLGGQWSHTVETKDGHLLVTDGIYAYLRHPIYTSLVVWAAAQPFLLHNWLVGGSGILAVTLIWLIRVPREEKMMLKIFGDQYRQYRAKTGMFLPKVKNRHP